MGRKVLDLLIRAFGIHFLDIYLKPENTLTKIQITLIVGLKKKCFCNICKFTT